MEAIIMGLRGLRVSGLIGGVPKTRGTMRGRFSGYMVFLCRNADVIGT